MKKKVTILGKVLPIWLIAILLIASGAGAAVGTVLQGNVVGEMPVAVSQALLVGTPVGAGGADAGVDISGNVDGAQSTAAEIANLTLADRFIGVVSDSGTAFQAAAEIDQGDIYAFWLPLNNASDEDLTAELTLNFPECAEVEVLRGLEGSGSDANIGGVVRTSFNTWKVTVDADAAGAEAGAIDPNEDSILIMVQIDDNCAPGYYSLSGEIHQISF